MKEVTGTKAFNVDGETAGLMSEGGGKPSDAEGRDLLSDLRSSSYPPLFRQSITNVVSDLSMADHAMTRLTLRDFEMLDRRASALEHHHLAPEPENPGKPPIRAGKALLKNLWVLAIMVVILAVIVVAKERIHSPEPLAGVHATTDGVKAFVMPLHSDSIDYLYLNLQIGPYFPPDEEGDGGGGGGGHRRRLLASLVGESLALQGGGQQPGAGNGIIADDGALTQQVKQLLAKPKRVLAHKHSRRMLIAGGVEEKANEEGDPTLPDLQVVIMQQNASVGESDAIVAAGGGGKHAILPHVFFPVSEPQFCTTKEGAAVKCSMSFTEDDLLDVSAGEQLYIGFQSTMPIQLVFKVEMSDVGWLGPIKNWVALAILGCVLIAIASEKIHRMWCAMLGAAFMMSLLLWMNMAPSLGLTIEWLDESTLTLLFGMMMIVGRLKDTGMFEKLSATTVRLSGGRMSLLSIMLMIATAFMSAFLDNVTTMLLMAPISISLMRVCNRHPIPLLMAQVLMSNIGGAATMVGDPPALIIGTALSSYIGFVDFIINMAPGVIMASFAVVPLILVIYRHDLLGRIQGYDVVLAEVKDYRITDWNLMAKCSYVTGAVLVGFLLHPVHHVDPAWFAVIGAIVLCVCERPGEVEEVVHSVEWDMLLFFAGMFIMIEAGAEIGMIDMIGGWLEAGIRAAPEESRLLIAIQIILWVSAIASALLDNIPYTITMVPVIEYLASAGLGLDLATLAWALNFGACFGGNGSLVGASANIVTATLSERAGEKITFLGWMKSGVPVMLVSVAIADVWLILRFCL